MTTTWLVACAALLAAFAGGLVIGWGLALFGVSRAVAQARRSIRTEVEVAQTEVDRATREGGERFRASLRLIIREELDSRVQRGGGQHGR